MIDLTAQRQAIDIVGLSWFESLKQQLPRMREELQLDERSYSQWLRESGLQHNFTRPLAVHRACPEFDKNFGR